jgi:SagB-type dehydrogenase family enzyme
MEENLQAGRLMNPMRTAFILLLLIGVAALAQTAESIALPPPDTSGGKPLMGVLKERKSERAFRTEKLSSQVLSNLLWAAFGINRPDGRRTAPSALNRQEIAVYVTLPEGVYLYDAKAHRLEKIISGDLRAATGTQPFVAEAFLNLVYVADYAMMPDTSDADKILYSGADTGFIGQNVYLYCASEGLATVIRAGIDRDALGKALKLRPTQKITLAQSVGYSK